MMVANNFILIINQTDFCLAYNQKEKSRYDNIPFNFKGIRCIGYFPTKDIQTPPLSLIRFLLMMQNVRKRMKYQFFELWDKKKLGYENYQK